jgi:TetR/AcrR family transcriptional regulator, transcriptional repressor for nem operon
VPSGDGTADAAAPLTDRSTIGDGQRMGRSSDARERLVRTGARLFLCRSYHAVGVDELCAAAEVHKGSFYHFFRSKSDLAKAVVDWHAEELWARLDQATAPAAEGAAGRLHAVADAVGEIQTGFEERFGTPVGCPFGNLTAELATTDESLHRHLAAVFGAWEDRLVVLCRDAAAEGTLRPDVAPELLARILIAQIQGMVLLAKTGRATAADVPRTLHQVIDSHLTRGVPV